MNEIELLNLLNEEFRSNENISEINEKEFYVIKKGKDLIDEILKLNDQERKRTSMVVLSYFLDKMREESK